MQFAKEDLCRPVASPHSWGVFFPSLPLPSPSLLSPAFPSLPFPSIPFPFPPLPSPPVLSPPFPSPPLRSRPPVLRLEGLGDCSSSPSGSGQRPAAKRFLVNCRLKIAPVVAMVLRRLQDIPVNDRSQKSNKLPCTSISTYHLLCNGTQKF